MLSSWILLKWEQKWQNCDQENGNCNYRCPGKFRRPSRKDCLLTAWGSRSLGRKGWCGITGSPACTPGPRVFSGQQPGSTSCTGAQLVVRAVAMNTCALGLGFAHWISRIQLPTQELPLSWLSPKVTDAWGHGRKSEHEKKMPEYGQFPVRPAALRSGFRPFRFQNLDFIYWARLS